VNFQAVLGDLEVDEAGAAIRRGGFEAFADAVAGVGRGRAEEHVAAAAGA